MAAKIYLHLLILCGVLCSGIIASLTGEDTGESSNFLVRKRRVINHLPGGITPTRIEEANYLVTIKENQRANCIGAILSHYTVVTAASCVRFLITQYHVYSGSGYPQRMAMHNVTSKVAHYGYPPHHERGGIALITVHPAFAYKRTVGTIQLYVGPLPVNTLTVVRGWGYSYPLRPGPEAQRRLRTAFLPIMDRRECQNIYHGRFPITEKYLCAYHSEQYCAQTDIGTPLVFNDKLAGIHVWKGESPGHRNPEVFIDIQSDDYSTWIRNNIVH